MILGEEAKSSLDSLTHFGVKGMKWGVRKNRAPSAGKLRAQNLTSLGPDKVVRKTKTGETMTLQKMPPTKLHRILARLSKKYTDSYTKGASFEIKGSNGKVIGGADVVRISKDELYLNLINIEPSQRGKGYATEVLKAAKTYGKKVGVKDIVLDVPASAKDAIHIYTKLGFKPNGKNSDDPNPAVSLIGMSYKVR